MSDKSLADLMKSQSAEQEKKKADDERKRKEDEERRKREKEAREARRKADLERQEQERLDLERAVATRAVKQKQAMDNASRTERAYMSPSIKFLNRQLPADLDAVPVEFLKGILFLIEGRVNWDKDKPVMISILKDYFSSKQNISRFEQSVKKIIL
nr:hypothetical protein [Candidatus Sigynarchaeota archaeon]